MSKISQMTTSKLIKLLQQKKMKDANAYIIGFREGKQYCKKAVIETFTNNLINHKTTPLGQVTTLMLYKSLILNQIQIIDNSEIFPKQIHKQLYTICTYNKQKEYNQKGTKYFSELFKMKHSQQLQQYGNTYVILALQIIQNIGIWYQNNCLTQQKSIFAVMYEKLKRQGIKFPKYGQYIIMKQKDKQTFMNEVQNWKEFLKEQEQQLDIDIQQQSNIKKDVNVFSALMKVSEQANKNNKNPFSNLAPQAKIISDLARNPREGLDSNVQYKRKQNTQLQVSYDNNKNNKQQRITYKEQNSKSKLSNSTIQLKTSIGNKQPINIQQQILQKDQVIKSENKMKTNHTRLIQQQIKNIIHLSIDKLKPKSKDLTKKSKKPIQMTPQKIVEFIAEKNDIILPIKIQSPIYQTPAKIRKRSFPKTQKTQLLNRYNKSSYLVQFNKKQLEKDYLNNDTSFMKSSYTKPLHLSQYRSEQKSQINYQRQVNGQYLEFLKKLQTCKYQYQLLFVPDYYKPITLDHKSLRRGALQILQNQDRNDCFYKDSMIQMRLIKNKFLYILTIQNISSNTITLQYKQSSSLIDNYTNMIRLLNQKRIWTLQSNSVIDIKFTFKTKSFNFKFLDLFFAINQKVTRIHLPITMLDQCSLSYKIDSGYLGNFEKFGKVIVATPISIQGGLPKFVQKLNFPVNENNSTHSKFHNVKGHVCFQLKGVNQQKNFLDIFFINIDNVSNKYQMHGYVDSSITDNENFGKVILQLLMFLLIQY